MLARVRIRMKQEASLALFDETTMKADAVIQRNDVLWSPLRPKPPNTLPSKRLLKHTVGGRSMQMRGGSGRFALQSP